MKKFYVVTALLLVHLGFGQTVNIPDTNFKNKLLLASTANSIATDLDGNPTAIDTNADGLIQVSEAQLIGGITIFSASINSAEGIAGFSNLKNLNLYNNHIAALDVSQLNLLQDLVCSRNPMTDLNLAGCNELTRLECDRTQITSLDVSNRPNLTEISCVPNNFLASINISGCSALTFFDCSFLSPGDPDSNGPLTSLNVAGCTSLETLNCGQNQLASLDLTGLSELKNLDCSYNVMTVLDIHGCAQLENLICPYNNLVALDITDNSDLTQIDCTANQLATLSLNGLSALESLICSDNQIIALNLFDLPSLITLYCDENKISGLSLTGCTNLEDLDCTGNQLTELDLSMLNHLSDMDCSDNEMLTAISIKNTSFEQSFVISGLPNLESVCCDAFQLTDIQEIVANYGYDDCTVTSSCELGVNSANEFKNLVVYPNPAASKISVGSNHDEQILSMAIYNTLGQLVKDINGNFSDIDVSSLSAGTYLVRIISGRETVIQKLIKN